MRRMYVAALGLTVCFNSGLKASELKESQIIYNNITPKNEAEETLSDSPKEGGAKKEKRANFFSNMITKKLSGEAHDPHKFSKEGYSILSQRVSNLEQSLEDVNYKQTSMFEQLGALASGGKGITDNQHLFTTHRYALLGDFHGFKNKTDQELANLKKSQAQIAEINNEIKSIKSSVNFWRGTTLAMGGALGLLAFIQWKKA